MYNVSFRGTGQITTYENNKVNTTYFITSPRQDMLIDKTRRNLFGSEFDDGATDKKKVDQSKGNLFRALLRTIAKKDDLPKAEETCPEYVTNTPLSVLFEHRASDLDNVLDGDGYDIKIELDPENIG